METSENIHLVVGEVLSLSCREVAVIKGGCVIQCQSTDGRNNKHEVHLKEGDHLVLQAGDAGVGTLSYSARTTDPGTILTTT